MKAAVYLRISRDKAGEGLGVERQLESCRHLAAAKGWEIDPDWIVNDNDMSASGVKKRPGFERLIRGMERGQVHAVLAYKVDRLQRRLDDMVRLWDVAKRRNVLIATVSGELDLTTPSGRSNAMLLGVVAAIEIENLTDRLQDKAEQSVKAGRNANGGSRPFGWNLRRTEHREDEAAIIRDLAGRLIGREPLASVVRDLNDRKVPTAGYRDRAVKALVWPGPAPRRIRWDVRKLREVLSNERHAGRVEHRGKVVCDDQGAPVKAQWEPILEPDVFDKLQGTLQARRVVRDAWTGYRAHLLSGSLLRCGACQARLAPFLQTNGKHTYRCRGHLARDRDRTDAFVLARIREHAHANPIRVTSWETEERAGLSDEIARLESRLADLEDNFVSQGGDAARLARLTAVIDAQLDALRAERLDRLAMETGVEWAQFDLDGLLGVSGSLLPNATKAEQKAKSELIEQQRNAIRLYAEQVTIHPSKIRGPFDESSIKIVWRDVNRLRWRAVVEA